jgi:chemotaxis protein methyltransferase CheR
VLYLGGAETVLGVTDRFVPIPGDRGVYGPAAITAPVPAQHRQAVKAIG